MNECPTGYCAVDRFRKSPGFRSDREITDPYDGSPGVLGLPSRCSAIDTYPEQSWRYQPSPLGPTEYAPWSYGPGLWSNQALARLMTSDRVTLPPSDEQRRRHGRE
jgi:hypothetical protein